MLGGAGWGVTPDSRFGASMFCNETRRAKQHTVAFELAMFDEACLEEARHLGTGHETTRKPATGGQYRRAAASPSYHVKAWHGMEWVEEEEENEEGKRYEGNTGLGVGRARSGQVERVST